MSSPHPTQTTAESTHPYEDILDQLITLGTDLAKQVHTAAGKDLPLDQATIAFDRIARAVRRTVHLARHLAKPQSPHSETKRGTAARKRIIREVEDAICSATRPSQPRGHDAEALHAELRERLEDPSLEDEIAGRSTEDIINDILRDLGLGHMGPHSPFQRRTPADIQALNTKAETRLQKPSPAGGRGLGGAGQGSTGPCPRNASGGEGGGQQHRSRSPSSTPPDSTPAKSTSPPDLIRGSHAA